MSCGSGCGCCPKCGCKASCSCGKGNEPLFLQEGDSFSWSDVMAPMDVSFGETAGEPNSFAAAADNDDKCECGKQTTCDCK